MRTSQKNSEKLGVIGRHFLTRENTEPKMGLAGVLFSFLQKGTSPLFTVQRSPPRRQTGGTQA